MGRTRNPRSVRAVRAARRKYHEHIQETIERMRMTHLPHFLYLVLHELGIKQPSVDLYAHSARYQMGALSRLERYIAEELSVLDELDKPVEPFITRLNDLIVRIVNSPTPELIEKVNNLLQESEGRKNEN